MKRKLLVVMVLMLTLISVSMAVEQIDLTTPITVNNYKIARLDLNMRGQRIEVILYDPSTGRDVSFTYTGAVAVTMITQLNKANLSTLSLQRRIFERLIADGLIQGTISGTPD